MEWMAWDGPVKAATVCHIHSLETFLLLAKVSLIVLLVNASFCRISGGVLFFIKHGALQHSSQITRVSSVKSSSSFFDMAPVLLAVRMSIWLY